MKSVIKNKLKSTATVATASLVSLLVACSSGPSESEIKSLVERDIKPMMEIQLKLVGGPKTALTDVKKLGCKADGNAAYKCDVELLIASADKKESKAMPIRFDSIRQD